MTFFFFIETHFIVVQSKSPQYVGIEGIVLLETANTFHIITKEDSLKGINFKLLSVIHFNFLLFKVVPKVPCIFEAIIGQNKVTIYGMHFNMRPADRGSKKFKSKQHIML